MIQNETLKTLENNNLAFSTCKIVKKNNNKNYYCENGYMDFDFKKSLEILKNKEKNGEDFDGLMILLKKKFVVFDTDDLTSYNNFLKLFENQTDLLYITPSYSNITEGKNYKNHFWFKVPEKYNEEFKILNKDIIKMIDKDENETNLDIIVSKIYEDKTNIIEYEKIPDIGDKLFKMIKKQYEKKFPEVYQNKNLTTYNYNNNNINEKDLINILDNLDSKRYNNYTYWRNIGFIFINEKLPVEIFKTFSIKSKKYNNSDFENNLKNWGKKTGLTVATLYKYLKEDNFTVFKELQKSRKDILNVITKFNPNDISKLYYQNHIEEYIYCEVGKGLWYEYDKYNKLIERELTPSSILNNISNEIQDILEDLRIDFKPPKDIEKMKDYKKTQTTILNCYNKAGDSRFIKSVIDFLKNLYKIDNFIDLVDKREDIFVFENKIYELGIGFRNIEKTDYVLTNCGYKFKKGDKKEEVYEFFESIFGEKDLVEYQLNIISSCLFGNKRQKFYIHKGSGANGKGVLNDLNNLSFGKYTIEGTSELFTAKSTEKCPVLAKAKGKRYLTVSEPDEGGGSFNIKLLLKMSGGDKLQVRDLFKSTIEYIPQFTPHLFTNDIPSLGKGGGNEIIRRFEVIDYPFEFKDKIDIDSNNPKHKLKDYNIKNKFDDIFINSYMEILFQKAEVIKNNNYQIIKPEKIINETNEYLEENDPLKEWFYDNIEITENKTDKIKQSDIRQSLNESTKLNFSQSEIKRRLKLLNILDKRETSGRYYIGIIYKHTESEFEDI